jgi:hypothetical protein
MAFGFERQREKFMRQPIFRQIKPPKHLAAAAVNDHATWHTWSDDFRAFLLHVGGELKRLPDPPTRRIKRLSDYNYTFSLPPRALKDAAHRDALKAFAQSLAVTRPRRKLMLFDGLLGSHLDGPSLHKLFALLRGSLVEMAGDDFAAMYTPLGDTGDDVGDFLLHADLYVPQYLFNVFDNVPARTGGSSTFLAVPELKRIVRRQTGLSDATARRLFSMFESEPKSDRYDRCYDLMHGEHRWVPALEQSLSEHQLSIPLRKGQGYLLHDRSWLHGRTKPTGGVTLNRVRRLIYGL